MLLFNLWLLWLGQIEEGSISAQNGRIYFQRKKKKSELNYFFAKEYKHTEPWLSCSAWAQLHRSHIYCIQYQQDGSWEKEGFNTLFLHGLLHLVLLCQHAPSLMPGWGLSCNTILNAIKAALNVVGLPNASQNSTIKLLFSLPPDFLPFFYICHL